ncbi:MAG: polysaccharide deacetylase family protein [Proteobacteria bacterium]|nr:polysaccharide deacetylase family protein [Pseudomonadota bacterium]
MSRNIYLTIDDAPSKHMKKKVDFLEGHKIPALFFCRGEFIPLYRDLVIDAIQKGFPIGNHSYSHPYFSSISLEECFKEILKTEELIDACYKTAGIERPFKVFRFPFGDRGGGEGILKIEENKVEKIQNFIKDLGFVSLKFQHKNPDEFVDILWDWDTEDYKAPLIQNSEKYLKKIGRILGENA